MAVQPVAALLALAWTRGRAVSAAKELMTGVIERLGEFDCVLAGGDTTSWPHPVAIDVTILAKPYPGIAPVRRDGARIGDSVFVTGPLGGSILGKHLSFTPRVREARALAEALGNKLHAMMDITDGLAIDLDRIAEASGVGALLDQSQVIATASDAAREIAKRDGRSVCDHVLTDGEDFELLIVGDVPPVEGKRFGLLPVGEIVEALGLTMRGEGGLMAPLEAKGYEHL
jgi:thiamine-monophosphate kinase